MAEATVIEVHLPGEVAAAMRMRDRSGTDEERVRVPLALGLFAQGTISLAKAAALAAMTRLEFSALLKRVGVPAFEYRESDYEDDLTFASSLQEDPDAASPSGGEC